MSQDRQTAQEMDVQPEKVRAAPWKVLSGTDPSGNRAPGIWGMLRFIPSSPIQTSHSPNPLFLFEDPLAAAREKEGAENSENTEESLLGPQSSPLGMGISDMLPSTWAGSQGTLGKALLGHHVWRVLDPLNHPQHCLRPREPSPAFSQATGRGTHSMKALPAWCGGPRRGCCSRRTRTAAFTPS